MAQQHDSSHPEGVYDDGRGGERASKELKRARERKGIMAAELYIRTKSWPRAAEGAGYPTPRAARVAAERAMEKEFHTNSRSQDFMRKYQAKHLDLMMGTLAAKTADANHPENIAAIKTVRELMAQQAKLLGLDAPTKVSLIDPTAEQIQEFVDKVMGPEDLDDEIDIFDVEVIEETPRELGAK